MIDAPSPAFVLRSFHQSFKGKREKERERKGKKERKEGKGKKEKEKRENEFTRKIARVRKNIDRLIINFFSFFSFSASSGGPTTKPWKCVQSKGNRR